VGVFRVRKVAKDPESIVLISLRLLLDDTRLRARAILEEIKGWTRAGRANCWNRVGNGRLWLDSRVTVL